MRPLRKLPNRRFIRLVLSLCLLWLFASASSAEANTEEATRADAPFVLRKGKTLEDLFGYAPDYVCNVPAFDARNRPYLRSRTASRDDTAFVATLRDGVWVEHGLLGAVRKKFPDFEKTLHGGGWHGARIVFDHEDTLYTCVTIAREGGEKSRLLLHSRNYGASFGITELPEGDWAWEHRAGASRMAGPPFLGVMRFFKADLAR